MIVTAERYEYSSPVKLDAISGNYFVIPSSIILATNVDNRRVSTFSFLSIRRGLDCGVIFLINDIVKWMGKQPDRHASGINNKILQIIEYLRDNEYLTSLEKITISSRIEAILNLSKISQECEYERFAVIYLDELKKILDYKNPNSKDAYLNNDIILLVFAYLRMKIYRRRNKLFLEEVNIENKNNHQFDIITRKERSPEAYNCYYCDIANELGLPARTISKVIDILNDLELIYSEQLPRVKYFDGNHEKWRTDHTIFCNTYKREGSNLLASGEDYYLYEVKNKKKKLNINFSKKGDVDNE